MLAKKLFDGKDPEEIQSILEDNCRSKEDTIVEVPMTDTETQLLEESIAEASANAHALERKKKQQADVINVELKPLKEKLKTESLQLHSGQKSVEMTLYLMEDMDAGMMMYYRPDGTLHSQRRLKQEERQMRII